MDKVERIKECTKELDTLFKNRGHKIHTSDFLLHKKMFYYGSAVDSLCFSYGYVYFRDNNEGIKRIINTKNVKEIDKLNRYLFEIILPTLKKWEVDVVYLFIGNNNEHISYILEDYTMDTIKTRGVKIVTK